MLAVLVIRIPPSSAKYVLIMFCCPPANAAAAALSGVRKWIDDQVEAKPTHLRAYYRERVNPRVDINVKVCASHSVRLAVADDC